MLCIVTWPKVWYGIGIGILNAAKAWTLSLFSLRYCIGTLKSKMYTLMCI